MHAVKRDNAQSDVLAFKAHALQVVVRHFIWNLVAMIGPSGGRSAPCVRAHDRMLPEVHSRRASP
jgi:hypothetical protein